THVLDGPPPYRPALANAVAETVADADGPVALVAHSGAGPLLPAVCDAVETPVAAAVFVDAGLPHPGRSWFDTAPAELVDQLRPLTREGMLPPWHEWFAPEEIAALLPDAVARDAVVGELRPIPVAFLDERAPEPAGWPPPRCAYLLLSDAYTDASRSAANAGWAVARHPSDHLAVHTDPEGVTKRLLTLVVGSSGRGEHGR
ncbi:MAG: hypothetical protein J2P14_09155, partial [Acidothermales bacterium]|nr:hypothetical protein [Acidothermales bacterium]